MIVARLSQLLLKIRVILALLGQVVQTVEDRQPILIDLTNLPRQKERAAALLVDQACPRHVFQLRVIGVACPRGIQQGII